MPNRNGTGPSGAGPLTGRGAGVCNGAGFGRGAGFAAPGVHEMSEKDLLATRRDLLERELSAVNSRLDALEDEKKTE